MTFNTIYRNLAFAGLITGACTIFSLNKDYQKSRASERLLNQIIQEHRLVDQPGKYLGHWGILPVMSSSLWHFGYNYQLANGRVEVHEFWFDYSTNQIVNQTVYELK